MPKNHAPRPFNSFTTGTGWRSLVNVMSAIMVSVTVAGCSGGGGDGGNGGSTNTANSDACVLTQEQIASIQNIDQLPAACQVLLPLPEDNLLGRVFVLGTQVDGASGELRIYVNGTDLDGQPLQVADFQAATVTIDGSDVARTVEAVTPGNDILSLGLVTDYSTSISDAELAAIGAVYQEILVSLPQVFETEVINFSTAIGVRLGWTENLDAVSAAIQRDADFPRDNTAFYDALGITLQQDLDLDSDGLIERCRPAHMLVAFTDGKDNSSIIYTKDALKPLVSGSKTVMIMLGTLNASSDELTELAGVNGAFAYAYNVSSVQAVVRNWSASLANMVKFTLDPATGFDSGVIEIRVGGQTATVSRPVDGFCEVAP